MNTTPSSLAAPAAVIGGAIFALTGAIHATQGDFGGTHNTIDSTAEYLVTGGLAAALAFTAPVYRLLGRRAGAPRAGVLAMVVQLVLAAISVMSVVQGEDAAIFNVVAPLVLLSWLAASVVIARAALRTGALPRAAAIGLPLLLVATFPLAVLGGGLLTGAYWMAVGTLLARGPQGAMLPAAGTA